MIDQYTFSFDLPIWKVLYSTNQDTKTSSCLAIETRDKERVCWLMIDIESYEIVWQKTPSNTNWWTTLSGFDGQYLTLSCYSGSNEPTPSKKIFLAQSSGETVEAIAAIATSNQTQTHWKNLTEYATLDEYYAPIVQFIEKIIGQTPQNTIFYGEIAKNIILVYYICNSDASALSPFLLVVSSQKVVLLHKPIEGGSSNVFSESCIYSQNQLIYLSGLNELTILRFF